MNLLHRTWAVVRFEFRKKVLAERLGTAMGLALLATLLLWLIHRSIPDFQKEDFAAIMALYFFLPTLLCALCLLLWAVPIVHAEVESSHWSFLAVRPYGKGAFLLGKYLTAVFWTIITGWISLGLCGQLFSFQPWSRTIGMLALLIVLASFAYGALFVLLGTIFLRRGMVAVVAYGVIIEGITAFLPAVIHHFTVQYHLRSLLLQWTPLAPRASDLQRAMRWFQEDIAWWVHVAALAAYTLILLTAAWWILHQRELARPQEN